jgi:hypothetical protein
MQDTFRVLTANPMQIVRRFLLALLGGFLAMGGHVYLTFYSAEWITTQRIGNSIAAGLIFGIVVGLMVVLASEYPARLRDVWSVPARLALALASGVILGTLAWFSYVYLLLQIEAPDWSVLLFGGIGLSAGFVLSGMVKLPRLVSIAITALAAYVPIFITFQNYVATVYNRPPALALLYYAPNREWMVFALGIPFALAIAILGQLRQRKNAEA